MYTIQLTQGKVTVLDREDYLRALQFKWCFDGSTGYAVTGIRSARKGTPQKAYLHRFVLIPPHGMTIDHINGDRLDNRRDNLRVVTRAENNRNRHNVAGAWQDKRDGRWDSSITIKGTKYNLGRFATKQEAMAAYAAAKQRMGSAED